MEEVLKGSSTLSSLHHHHPTTSTTSTHHAFHGLNLLQDFFSKASPTKDDSHETFLSLNSGSEFHHLQRFDRTRSHPEFQSHGNRGIPSSVFSLNSPFDALASSTAVFTPSCYKRASEYDDKSRDRRHKRMIKNRESAVRSRARKQAYTNQLEDENARLMEENAELRRQLEKLPSAGSAQLPKKHTLHRTLTAPF